MIKLKIDGKEMEAKPGSTVLNAALGAGIYIPHLCDHPDLKPAGACRLCLVELEGMEGVQPPAICAPPKESRSAPQRPAFCICAAWPWSFCWPIIPKSAAHAPST